MSIQLPESWLKHLEVEFKKPYMLNLKEKLTDSIKKNKTIYPKGSDIFKAFHLTDFQRVKVVILGQDPYHGKGQAHGLSFSVPIGLRPPPSLKNIYKELKNDLKKNFDMENGNLESWSSQGVFLLNTTLTVEKSLPMSHKNFGWEEFTDKVIQTLNDHRKNIVFILWGAHAQSKIKFINSENHLVIKSVHPSPLSAHRGFFGSRPFSQTNDYLVSKEIDKINWI